MRKKKIITLALCFLLILGIFAAIAMAAEGAFTIKKVDQNKEPIEDVEFEVYGKPILEVERKVIIQKLHVTENNMMPFEEEVTVHVEGDGVSEQFTATRESHSLEITLKPGTYKIYEDMPEESAELPDELFQNDIAGWQYFLSSGELIVKDDGNIKLGEMKWNVLTVFSIYDWDEYKWNQYYVLNEAPSLSDDKHSVQFDGNVVTITNSTKMPEHESQVQE